MTPKWIKTQNGDLVNTSHIIRITMQSGDITDDTGAVSVGYSVDGYDLAGKLHELGVYFEAALCEKTVGDIAAWMDDNTAVFTMPEEG